MKFRQFISIIFLAVYSVTVFSSLLPYAEYVLNYKYISTQLCENKDKPELKCNGKCHLKKQIEKTVEKTTPSEKEKSNTAHRIIEFSPVILNPENTIYIGVNLFARELFLKEFILKSRTLDSDFKPPTTFLFIS